MIYAIALIILGLLGPPKTCDPALERLFTPARARYGRYEVCTTPESLEKTASGLAGAHLAEPERLEALDVFGASGSYDRAALARLYGGQRATVVRAWRDVENAFESLTLISPYPDPSLTRLDPGTMIVRWILPSGRAASASRP